MGSLIDGKLNADGGLSTCPNDVALKSDMAGAFAAAVKARERSRSREAHSGTTELSRLREPSGRRRSDGVRHICVDLPSGKSITMSIKEESVSERRRSITDEEIKEAIYAKVGIPAGTYELLAATDGWRVRTVPHALFGECERYIMLVGGSEDAAASGASSDSWGPAHPPTPITDCKGVPLRAMQIFVTPMLTGRVLINVMPEWTIDSVKAIIRRMVFFNDDLDVPIAMQRLYYVNKRSCVPESLQLNNGSTLRGLGLQHGDTLELRCHEEESVAKK